MVDGLDDVRRLGAALVADAVGHADPAEVAEVRQEVGDVEDRGDRLAPARLADEREVGDRDGWRSWSAASWRSWVRPVPCQRRAVDDEPVGHREESFAGLRAERRLVRPPDRDRQVVDEQRGDDRVEVAAGLAAARQVDRLGAGLRGVRAGHDAVGLDLGVEPGRTVGIGGRDDRASATDGGP